MTLSSDQEMEELQKESRESLDAIAGRYTSRISIRKALEKNDVALMKGKWLVEVYEKGGLLTIQVFRSCSPYVGIGLVRNAHGVASCCFCPPTKLDLCTALTKTW